MWTRILFFGTAITWSVGALCAMDGSRAEVLGYVSCLSDPPSNLAGAVVVFHRSDGSNFKATTNEAGEYDVYLAPSSEYSVSVEKKGFYPIHRPSFRPQVGSTLRFDFTTAPCCDRNVFPLVVPSGETNPTPERDEDVHHASTDVFNRYYRYPYHDEETFDFGPNPTHKLMLAFGIFNQKDGKVTYESLPVPAPPPPITPRNYLPVTISFDTYTITATTVVLDRKTRELRADGTVWIADGSSSPPRLVSCAVVRLDDAEPQVHECETGPSEHGASK